MMRSRFRLLRLCLSGIALACAVWSCAEPLTSAHAVTGTLGISVGEGHSCSLDRRGASCWGTNQLGGLGIGAIDTVRRATAEKISAPLHFVDMDAGQYHTCALTASGEAWCWGYGALGQLGDGRRQNSGSPVPVAGGLRFRAISAGGEHTCGIGTDDVTYCWGSNGNAQLASSYATLKCGPDGRPCSSVPMPIEPALPFRSISAGGLFTCGVHTSGDIYCWGNNVLGTLGAGTFSDFERPRRVESEARFKSVSAGAFHACALTQAGDAWCWGYNLTGQFGFGDSSSAVPVRAAPLIAFSELSAGYLHTCGVDTGGLAYCWGENKTGQLGAGTRVTFSREPRRVASGVKFQHISGGIEHTCALSRAGISYCWGGNSFGQLGSGTAANTYEPVKVVASETP